MKPAIVPLMAFTRCFCGLHKYWHRRTNRQRCLTWIFGSWATHLHTSWVWFWLQIKNLRGLWDFYFYLYSFLICLVKVIGWVTSVGAASQVSSVWACGTCSDGAGCWCDPDTAPSFLNDMWTLHSYEKFRQKLSAVTQHTQCLHNVKVTHTHTHTHAWPV